MSAETNGLDPSSPRAEIRRRAEDAVRLPATFLMIVGGGGAAVCLGAAALLLFVLDDAPSRPGRWFALSLLAPFLAVSCGALLGGWSMIRLRSYRSAVAGAVCGTVSIWCTVLGTAVGVWNLVVLQRREVRAAFDDAPAASPTAAAVPAAAPASFPVHGPATMQAAPVGPPPTLLPGAFLLGVGVLGVGFGLLMFLVPNPQGDPAKVAEEPVRRVIGVGYALWELCVAATGVALMRRRLWTLCVVGSVLAILNCTCLVAVPLGIWSLVVLLKPGVRESFVR